MPDSMSDSSEDDEVRIVKRRRKTTTSPPPRPRQMFEDVVNTVSDETAPSIHMLNDECLDVILSHLTTIEHFRLALVCRRWYNVCHTKISLLTSLSCDTESCLSCISLNCGSLTLLKLVLYDFEFSLPESETIFVTISKNCPNLLGLDLGLICIDQKLSKQLSQNFPKKLKYLTICVNEEECLDRILMKAESLEKLYLSSSCDSEPEVGDIDGSSITKHLIDNKMTAFSFDEFYNGDNQLKLSVVEFILNNYRSSLEHLNFSRSAPQLLNVSTDHSKKFPNMKRFFALASIGGETFQSRELIQMNLQKLSIFLCLMPNLTLLDLTGNCDLQDFPLFFIHVAESCPLLESLNLSQCNLPAQNLIHLKNFRFLKRLKLYSLDNILFSKRNCVNFDFTFFAEHVVGGLKALRYLNITGNININDHHIFLIIQNLQDNTDFNFILNIEPIEDGFIINNNLNWTFIVQQCHSINRSSIVEIICGDQDILDVLGNMTAKAPPFMRIKKLQDTIEFDDHGTIQFKDNIF